MTIEIREEQPPDADAIDRVHREAFEGEAEVALVRALRAATQADDFISWVACQGGDVIAHVLLSPMEIHTDSEPHAALALAPLAVLPAHQRRGIGTALTERALARAREAGHRCVLVLGDPAYYERFGFEPAASHGITPPEAGWAPHYGVLSLDGAPTPRGTAVYPAAFEGV